MYKKERDVMQRFQDALRRRFVYVVFGGDEVRRKVEERRERNKDNLKWAYVFVGSTRKLCMVDNVTMKAYKVDGYAKTNIEIKNFRFNRWCTSFDL
jgi:hypothetical protein